MNVSAAEDINIVVDCGVISNNNYGEIGPILLATEDGPIPTIKATIRDVRMNFNDAGYLGILPIHDAGAFIRASLIIVVTYDRSKSSLLSEL